MKEYKTTEHIVAFIDILGATAKIKENVDESLNAVHKTYDLAIRSLEQLLTKMR